MTVQTIKYQSITSNEMKTGRASHLHHLLLTPISSPSLSFFRIIMTFSAEFRCYIGRQMLASWATTLAGLLPPWPTTLGHNAAAHDAMFLTPWVTTLCLSHAKGPLLAAPSVVGHSVMSLTPWATAADV
jgi:hypothetical protein